MIPVVNDQISTGVCQLNEFIHSHLSLHSSWFGVSLIVPESSFLVPHKKEKTMAVASSLS